MIQWILDALVMGGGAPGMIVALQLSWFIVLIVADAGAGAWWFSPLVVLLPWIAYWRWGRARSSE